MATIRFDKSYDAWSGRLNFHRHVGLSSGITYYLPAPRRDISRKRTKRASFEGIQLKSATGNRSRTVLGVQHKVGDPLCAAGSIRYDVVTTTTKNGASRIRGKFINVPSHQISVRPAGKNWSYRFKKGTGFGVNAAPNIACLLVPLRRAAPGLAAQCHRYYR